ncbi:MAG: hypothetical protein A3A86_07355 [Elusimicrobia bacterium RIFCSPLOWO2_01_FULL_60_11]|nr:MAG: hypothetical protein A3A86_07355 [Elusimicrobia bacterium RIFCSPLOWO2_01_FULL_60_11]
MSPAAEKIFAVVPAYNEEGKIGTVVAAIVKENIVETVVVVDDGSRDKTFDEAKRAGAVVIRHEKNRGVGTGIRSGLLWGKQQGYTIAVILGGDDQDNPHEIHRLLAPILNDHFLFVQGSRYMPGGARVNIPLFRWITTGLFSFIFKLLTRFPITDGTNGFRAFRLSILDTPGLDVHQKWLDKYELEPYLYYKSIELGLNVTEVPVTKRYPKGKVGYTKMVPFLDWWSIIRPLVFLRLGLKK